MRCFRLKSSPLKKTFRLRCFFFMGAGGPSLGGEAIGRTIQFIGGRRGSREELEGVLGGAGQERGGVPADPGLVTRPEIRRERVGALPARHVEYPLRLPPRGDDEALARPH